eukprot:SAG31_NODE_27418_length_426_cov_0.917431_1_plen_56_part_10
MGSGSSKVKSYALSPRKLVGDRNAEDENEAQARQALASDAPLARKQAVLRTVWDRI